MGYSNKDAFESAAKELLKQLGTVSENTDTDKLKFTLRTKFSIEPLVYTLGNSFKVIKSKEIQIDLTKFNEVDDVDLKDKYLALCKYYVLGVKRNDKDRPKEEEKRLINAQIKRIIDAYPGQLGLQSESLGQLYRIYKAWDSSSGVNELQSNIDKNQKNILALFAVLKLQSRFRGRKGRQEMEAERMDSTNTSNEIGSGQPVANTNSSGGGINSTNASSNKSGSGQFPEESSNDSAKETLSSVSNDENRSSNEEDDDDETLSSVSNDENRSSNEEDDDDETLSSVSNDENRSSDEEDTPNPLGGLESVHSAHLSQNSMFTNDQTATETMPLDTISFDDFKTECGKFYKDFITVKTNKGNYDSNELVSKKAIVETAISSIENATTVKAIGDAIQASLVAAARKDSPVQSDATQETKNPGFFGGFTNMVVGAARSAMQSVVGPGLLVTKAKEAQGYFEKNKDNVILTEHTHRPK